jgi:hypothetical protein
MDLYELEVASVSYRAQFDAPMPTPSYWVQDNFNIHSKVSLYGLCCRRGQTAC